MSTSTTVPHSVELLKLTAATEVPSSAAAYDALAGEGECLTRAVQSDMYRGWASKVRALFCKLAAAGTGVARRVIGTKTIGEGEKAKEVNILEKEQSYADFLVASGHSLASLQAYMTEAAAATPFVEWLKDEPSAAGSNSGGKIAKGDLANAEAIMARWASGAVNEKTGVAYSPETFLAGLESRLADPTLPENPTVEDVARLVAQYRKAQDLTSELG